MIFLSQMCFNKFMGSSKKLFGGADLYKMTKAIIINKYFHSLERYNLFFHREILFVLRNDDNRNVVVVAVLY